MASFFTTERPGYHNRATNRQIGIIAGYEPEEVVEALADPSMALRSRRIDDLRLRPEAIEAEDEEVEAPTDADAVSIRSAPRRQQIDHEAVNQDEDAEPTVLTPRQMRDRLRAEEAEATAAESNAEPISRPRDPLHWLFDTISWLVGRHK